LGDILAVEYSVIEEKYGKIFSGESPLIENAAKNYAGVLA